MIKKLKLFGFIGVFFLLPGIYSVAASDVSPTLITPLSEFERSFKDLIKKASLEQQFYGNGIEKIYLYGWSKNGLLAYGIDTIGECDIYDRIIVKDLVTDLELYSCDGSCNGESDKILNEEGRWIEFPSFKESWRYNWSTISAYFSEKGIRYDKKSKLRQFPIKFRNDRIDAQITTVIKKDTLEIKGMKLIVESKKKGRKVVHSETFDADSNLGFPIIIKVLGYVRSPYENRIGIVLAQQFWQMDGTVKTYLQIYGAGLSAGYSQ